MCPVSQCDATSPQKAARRVEGKLLLAKAPLPLPLLLISTLRGDWVSDLVFGAATGQRGRDDTTGPCNVRRMGAGDGRALPE